MGPHRRGTRPADPHGDGQVLAWQGLEANAATVFAQEQLVAVRTACAEELGRPVDWDDPASYRDDLEGRYESPTKPWTVGDARDVGGDRGKRPSS
ncbi:DUF6584 family protein [Streptomyces sp. DSM 118148]|uniref:DUF6584 family protein n=1 Tax=Streptomyces sp. DSM 118148 TaxID=3448667 RepID=UPI00403FF23A